MAFTVATEATDILTRLKLTADSGAAPSATNVQDWLRDAVKYLCGRAAPVFETTGTASSTAFTLTQAADEVYFVAVGPDLLFPGEWEKQAGTIKFQPIKNLKGSTVQVWYSALPDVTGATIETSCIFGDDWLEEAAKFYVMRLIQHRMQASDGTADANYASLGRVLMDDFDRIVKPLQDRRSEWFDMMNQRLQMRAAFGSLPAREHRVAGFRNRSRIRNSATGVG